MFGWDTALYLLVASYVLSAVFAPKAASPAPVAFEDVDFPQADEGTPQRVFFGDCWTSDWTVIGLGNYRTTPIKSDGGGK